MNKIHFGFAALVAMAACGGTVVEGTGAGTTGNGAGTTGTGAGTTGTGATGNGGGTNAGPCPASAPSGGTSCAGVPDQFHCGYGDSVRPDCRAEWVCSGGIWTTTKGICPQPPPGACSPSEPTAGTTCSDLGDVCVYGDTICSCGCGGGFCGPNSAWLCTPPPSPPCPAIVPNDGTVCAVEGMECTYGDVCSASGAMVNCTNGRWLWNTMIACAG